MPEQQTLSPRDVRAAAVACLVVNAFVWGISWWPFKELQARGVHPLWATALVYALAMVSVMLFARGGLRGLAQHPQLLWLALASGLTNVGFNWAVTIGDVVRVVLLFYLMPAWSALLAWLLMGERPTRASLLRVVLSLAGVVIILKPAEAAWPWPSGAADWLALLGGFSFALTNLLLLKYNDTPSAARMAAMFGGGAALAAVAGTAGLLQGAIAPLPAPDSQWLVLGLGLALAFLVGNLALQYGAARLSAHTTALVMLSEVVFASVSSVALGASQFGAQIAIGAALILAAAVWASWPTGSSSH